MFAMRLMKISVLANIIRKVKTRVCEFGVKAGGVDVDEETFHIFVVILVDILKHSKTCKIPYQGGGLNRMTFSISTVFVFLYTGFLRGNRFKLVKNYDFQTVPKTLVRMRSTCVLQ